MEKSWVGKRSMIRKAGIEKRRREAARGNMTEDVATAEEEREEQRGERIGGERETVLCNQSIHSYSVCSDKDNQF